MEALMSEYSYYQQDTPSSPEFLLREPGWMSEKLDTPRKKILDLVVDTLFDYAGLTKKPDGDPLTLARHSGKYFCDPVRGYERAAATEDHIRRRGGWGGGGIYSRHGGDPVWGVHEFEPRDHYFFNSKAGEDYITALRNETSGIFGKHSIPYEERQPAQLAEHIALLSKALLRALNMLVAIGYWASDPADHGGLVHFTAGGTKYHVALDCSALKRGQRGTGSSQPIETALLDSLRRGKGEKTACKTCCPPAEDD